jgi:predicted SAM-dependent methyltransferase
VSSVQLRGFIKSVLPKRVVISLRFIRQRVRAVIHGPVTKVRCKSMNGARVNVGCGRNPTGGWVNLDVQLRQGVMWWDITKGLPFNDDTVEAIYSEHFFEHLDYESEAKQFLGECLRCLKPHGTLRIVVPDAGAYLRLYAKGGWGEMAVRRPLIKEGDNYRDHWLGSVYKTRMEFVNAVFRQSGAHKYAYDAETLILMLQEAGFSSASETSYNVSSDPNMASDCALRKTESLYVEGRK